MTQHKLQASTTCQFTLDNKVDSVYYSGVDVTAQTSGDRADWNSVKSVSVIVLPDEYLVINGHNLETTNDACTTGGFQMYCDNGLNSGSSGLQAYGSDSTIDNSHRMGQGSGWITPCTSTSGFFLSGHHGPEFR